MTTPISIEARVPTNYGNRRHSIRIRWSPPVEEPYAPSVYAMNLNLIALALFRTLWELATREPEISYAEVDLSAEPLDPDRGCGREIYGRFDVVRAEDAPEALEIARRATDFVIRSYIAMQSPGYVFRE